MMNARRTNFDYLHFAYSQIGEEQSLLKEMLDFVSTPTDYAMSKPGMAAQDGVWGIESGVELVPGVLPSLCTMSFLL